MSSDVVFTYVTPTGQTTSQTLRWDQRINSREALGLWRVNNDFAWKVYRQRNQLQALQADYARAQTYASLPMGSPTFVQGTVRYDGRTTNGFVLITAWMVGSNFQKTAASFRSALSAQNMPRNPTNQDYLKTRRACVGAQTLGLRDCQGFIQTGRPANFDTLRFIDIHTGWNPRTNRFDPSEQATELVEEIDRWAR